MVKDLNKITDLFLAYFLNECTIEETEELQKWISESEENSAIFRECRELWIAGSVGVARRESSSSEAFDKFKAGYIRKTKKKTNYLGWFLGFATAAAAVCLMIIVSFNMGQSKVKQTFADMVIEAPMGSRTRVVLPDSTEVWLNSGSTISYSQGFGVNDRKVKLRGEGHFTVTKDSSKPFSVDTKELSLTVLGTVFNFKNYEEDEEVVVTLEEGRVALSNKISSRDDTYLSPDQSFILNKKTGKSKVIVTNPATSSLWISGRLFFDEMLLSDIAKELERCYNVEISIEGDNLANSRFYGDFSQKELSLDEILEALSNTGRIHGLRKGKHVTLY